MEFTEAGHRHHQKNCDVHLVLAPGCGGHPCGGELHPEASSSLQPAGFLRAILQARVEVRNRVGLREARLLADDAVEVVAGDLCGRAHPNLEVPPCGGHWRREGGAVNNKQ